MFLISKEPTLSPTQKRIVEIVKKLGNDMEGRKKLMKLLFFLNYYDFEDQKGVKEPLFGEDFIIYHYGPFSPKVRDEYLDLVEKGILEDGFPIKLKEDVSLDISIQERKTIHKMLEELGGLTGKELETKSLLFLGLNLRTKQDFFNQKVGNFVKTNFSF